MPNPVKIMYQKCPMKMIKHKCVRIVSNIEHFFIYTFFAELDILVSSTNLGLIILCFHVFCKTGGLILLTLG